MKMSNDVLETIVTQSPRMHSVLGMVRKVADATSNVLITGESGTGKELIARAVHQMGSRNQSPYIAVDCGSIPENLMESELFGHEKGAFTGACSRRIGKFEVANRGTLFLDEIANVPYDLQPKLLRVLQERVVNPVGGRRPVPAAVRVLAACNVNLDREMAEGRFRRDLYYRLKVVPIELPPLRERKEDIPLLAHFFLRKFNLQLHKRIEGFSEQVLTILTRYDWPGNVRELENLVERMVVLGKGDGVLTLKDLPVEVILAQDRKLKAGTSRTPGLKKICQSFERQVILKTLDEVKWNQSKAAKVLKIHRNTLHQKIEGLGKEL
ncbi:MAG: sigma-54-dependent Fis family transcriptional regulator [Nitrospirae bacterium]|nr:sigma-54-dependent Fis family transcriptional regulator [Nitrospirota bacterium]